MQIRTVLVPLDGSELSDAAVPYARAIAKATGASARLLGVVEPVGEGLTGRSSATVAHLTWTRREHLLSHLIAVAARETTIGLEVERELREGQPVGEISQIAADRDVDLIVMATHGRGGLRRTLVGSVADEVMRTCERPVLLVPPHDAGTAPPIALRRLLVPLDGSELAETALGLAAELARCAGATLVLAQVKPYGPALGQEYFTVPEVLTADDAQAADVQEYLRRLRNRIPAGVTVEAHILRGATAPALIEFIGEAAIDLTIMTTHGHGGFRRLVLGSVADRMVRLGAPVMLIPAVHATKALARSAHATARDG